MAGGIVDFFRRIRGMINGTLIRNISEVAKEQSAVSDKMMNAVELWTAMFEGDPEYLDADDSTLCLPAIIAAEFARAVTLEMEATVTGGNSAELLNEWLNNTLEHIRPNTEFACATGGIVFKPYVNDEDITVEIVHADGFYPIKFDNTGKITSAFFLYRQWDGNKIYSRLEKHTLEGTDYTVTNKAYVSTIEEALGEECNLSEVEEWAEIEPEVLMVDVDEPLFAYFKMPMGNAIDSNSPLGVSVYSRAVSLIIDADEQYQRLIWEYEGGELAIDASTDAFRMVNGVPMLPEGKERLYRTNDLDPSNAGGSQLMKEWAPTLRDANYMNGLQRQLRQVEDACSLYRGALSDPDADPRTATEILTTRQRYYSQVTDIQKSLENALDKLVAAMQFIGVLYDIIPLEEYETSYHWDDSVVMDAESERAKDLQDVREGLMTKYEYRMKWYGETEEDARAKIDEIENADAEKMTDEFIMGFNEPEAPKQKKQEEEQEEQEEEEEEPEE